jgi:hypothetical protein
MWYPGREYSKDDPYTTGVCTVILTGQYALNFTVEVL